MTPRPITVDDLRPWRGDPAEIVAALNDNLDPLARLTARRPAWHAQAACAGADLQLFFPPKGAPRTAAKARAICADCPVKAECLAEAVADPALDFGIRGGQSARQRRQLRGWRA